MTIKWTKDGKELSKKQVWREAEDLGFDKSFIRRREKNGLIISSIKQYGGRLGSIKTT